ncbi:aminotransferase class I/II-fold pyridoxal phosphate-dependent enzyme [Cohnella faecalis]|uniref:aminotransferase class I/II-fold pyridoxal phosphate-dependent enzyme n=1 Tax=Cohnella faecalis TaxID=2315694 RepID=UPI002D775D0A|nr:aminotransferase class I/II-fold pyridoxal phosphate-dependent enzyme [Cohnella faecalis]
MISLGVGEPDFVTPWRVRDAAVYALEKGKTQYTPNAGTPSLGSDRTIFERPFQVVYNPANEILVTVGGSEGIDLALRALIEQGDEILIPEPCYISYSPITTIGVEWRRYRDVGEDEFKLTAESLRAAITPRSKILVLATRAILPARS